MSEVTVLGGDKSVELPARLFDVQTNVPLIHQVVVAQLAAARQGTHSTKTRGEVSGGGAKPWRQKGTGRARQGSRRAPQWTGGGTVHGPKPRDYAQRTPKKMIAAALFGALSDRARDGRVHVIEQIVAGETPSTKAALKALASVGGAKLLVVLSRDEDVAWLSLRNVPTVHALVVDQLNAYDVLLADEVVFTSAALEMFVTRAPVSSSHTPVVEAPAAKPAKAPVEDAVEAPVKKRAAKATKPVEEPVEEAAPVVEPVAVEVEEPVEAAAPEAPADEPAKPARARRATKEAKDYGEGSYRGSTPPEGFDIKGNEGSMKFHTTESPWYARTVAEVWFNSEAAAEAAGFVNAQAARNSQEDAK